MVGVVPYLAHQRLCDGVALISDVNQRIHLVFRNALKRLEGAGPARFPFLHHCLPGLEHIFKFQITLPEIFFTVCRKVVCKPGHHVAPEMIYDDGNRVALGIVLPEKILIFQLREGFLSQELIVLKLLVDGVYEMWTHDLRVEGEGRDSGKIRSIFVRYTRSQKFGYLFSGLYQCTHPIDMKKVLLITTVISLLGFGAFKGYRYYGYLQEEKRKAPFYENLVDTSSPTVSVLRDSILIDYQDERRTVHVYVPPGYETDSAKRYPVMYMMDGRAAFNDLENHGPEWQIDEVINAADSGGGPTAIVIAINSAENRDAEYTPWINEDNPTAHGEAYAEWMATDLKTWVDSTYRTKPEPTSTYVGGISRSGMMAYYILMAHPEVFGNAIIQSPAMWVDRDRLLAMQLTEEQLQDKKIFVSVGEYEGRIMIPDAEAIVEKFQAAGLMEDRLRFELIAGEGHWDVTWRKSFALAYPWLMK